MPHRIRTKRAAPRRNTYLSQKPAGDARAGARAGVPLFLSAARRQAQPRLRLGRPGDAYEQEAERVAGQVAGGAQPAADSVQRQARPGAGESAPPIVARALAGPGQPLEGEQRAAMEGVFGQDLGQVQLHTDAEAARAAESIDARAFTLGSDIGFAAGEYAPETSDGRRLLAHELTHVIQQGGEGGGETVQRDLKAYNTPKTEVLPSAGMMDMSTTMITMTAEAPGIRAALAGLIAQGKVKEVTSTSGNVSWFAAQHHKNAQLDEIRAALDAAGYARADKLARSIYDIHGEYLYSREEISTVGPFYSHTTDLGEKIRTQTERSMTEWEIGQARRVFGNAIDYAKVTIAEGSLSAIVASAGGYARTIGNTINFPEGGSRSMAFMIHELTHVWQYQTTGWTYAPAAIWAQISEGYSYTDEGKSAEQSLIDARAAGKTLSSYNNEQQGDILSDYYARLQGGKDVSAWQPFVDDI